MICCSFFVTGRGYLADHFMRLWLLKCHEKLPVNERGNCRRCWGCVL